MGCMGMCAADVVFGIGDPLATHALHRQYRVADSLIFHGVCDNGP